MTEKQTDIHTEIKTIRQAHRQTGTIAIQFIHYIGRCYFFFPLKSVLRINFKSNILWTWLSIGWTQVKPVLSQSGNTKYYFKILETLETLQNVVLPFHLVSSHSTPKKLCWKYSVARNSVACTVKVILS